MLVTEHTFQDTIRAQLEDLSRPMPTDTSRRLQRLVALFRALIAVALIVVALVYKDPPIVGARYPTVFLMTGVLYAIMAWVGLVMQRTSPDGQRYMVPVQLFLDIFCITIMMHASGGISSGIGSLLVVYVGAATLTLWGRHAFLAAAISALAILGEQLASFTLGLSTASEFVPAGVLGAIIFAIASAAHPLARRLQESEALAHQRGIDLANMAQLNDYIIQHLRESIVVVDDLDNVRLINQSAAKHLGADALISGQPLFKVSRDLHLILLNWRRNKEETGTQASFVSTDGSTRINASIAPLERRAGGPVLIFLEDASLLAEKVQQTKLAALGRLSASIAHEIRNPVGALSHAGQLLEESASVGDSERRLLDIIRTNSNRVSDIVDNVLQLSRREPTNPELIPLGQWTREFVDEFSSTLELADDQIVLSGAEEFEVRMDPSHLRQICWNLCENAVKYGAGANGKVAVEVNFGRLPGIGRPYLEVSDRGAGIPANMRDHLFEPFATGRAGGTGLGLFISRELCECNRSALIFEPRPDGGCTFRVVFADPQRWRVPS
jgi:two-component system sensor histidine kinase PilS (NtrC family)